MLSRAIACAALAAAIALAALMLIPAALGYERYVITSGSMTGSYDRGSLIYDEIVPTASLRVGDVITYTPPTGSGPAGRITHRIVSIRSDREGNRIFRTKGDANAAPDPWRFNLSGPTQAKVVAHAPYVGFVFAALAIKEVRMAVIGLPALLIALALLAGLWREAGEEARGRESLGRTEASAR